MQQHQTGVTRGPQNPANSPGLSTQRVPVPPRQQGMPPHPPPVQSSQSSVMPSTQVGQPINQPTTNQPGLAQHTPTGIQHPSQPGISRYPSQPGVSGQSQAGQPVVHHQPRTPSQPGVRAFCWSTTSCPSS